MQITACFYVPYLILYVRVNINNEEANTQICVFNTCAGIPEEEQGKIFDEFYKIDKSRSREDSGHGLGLPIVRTIANLHGGSVRVRNIKGGVEFILTIPSVM